MSKNISLECQCGSFKGVVTDIHPSMNKRAICMCDDCQSYAHYLRRPHDILDRNGGTDITAVMPSQVRFTEGADKVRCVRLSGKGLYRFFASCCNTPIGNVISPAMPYVGMVQPIMNHRKDQLSREQAVGPVITRMMGKYGIPPLPAGTSKGVDLKAGAFILGFLARAYFKNRPSQSPFFDENGEPRAQTLILTPPERSVLLN